MKVLLFFSLGLFLNFILAVNESLSADALHRNFHVPAFFNTELAFQGYTYISFDDNGDILLTLDDRIVHVSASGEVIKTYTQYNDIALLPRNAQFTANGNIVFNNIEGSYTYHIELAKPGNLLQKTYITGHGFTDVGDSGRRYFARWRPEFSVFDANMNWLYNYDPGSASSTTQNGRLYGSIDIVEFNGDIFVSDFAGNRIQQFTANAAFIKKWITVERPSLNNNSHSPFDVSSSGEIYVYRRGQYRDYGGSMLKTTPSGMLEYVFGADGVGPGRFDFVSDVTFDGQDVVHVVDMRSNYIQRFQGAAFLDFLFGNSGVEAGKFVAPEDVAFDSANNFYVADLGNDRIQKFAPSGEFLIEWGGRGSGPGQLKQPSGVAVSPDGMVYVLDTGNSRVQKFSTSGQYLGEWSTSGTCIEADSSGSVYVGNHHWDAKIAKFNSDGSLDATFSTKDKFYMGALSPSSLALNQNGHMYVADKGARIVKIDADTGDFIQEWGSVGEDNGQFQNMIAGIGVDDANNVYVVDTGNNRVQVFSPSGEFQVAFDGAEGDLPAFYKPHGIAFGKKGFAVIADRNNHFIRVFTNPNVLPDSEVPMVPIIDMLLD